MTDYQVTITADVDAPPTEEEVDAFFGYLPDPDAAVAAGDATLSATLSATGGKIATVILEALNAFEEAAARANVPAREVVEVECVTEQLADRRIDEGNTPDLVSATEVASILGVSRQRVHQMISETPSFPPPLMRLGSGPLWLRSTMEAWSKIPRRAGRPRTAPLAEIVEDITRTAGRVARDPASDVERAISS